MQSAISTFILLCGKANFTNLSRFSDYSERTYRSQYQRSFNFIQFNQQLIHEVIPDSKEVIAAIDCSFIPKAGQETYGLGNFYNGSVSKTERGLEISVIAVIDVDRKQGYSLSVQQTADKQSSEIDKSKSKQKQESRVESYIEQLRATKPYLPKQVRYIVGDGFYRGASHFCKNS